MSDILEVVVLDEQFELAFNDQPLEVLIQEDNFVVQISQDVTEIVIDSEDIEILTIAEQGPPGVGGGSGGLFPMSVGLTPPSNPQVGDLWLDMN
jgi:hypothetical protein